MRVETAFENKLKELYVESIYRDTKYCISVVNNGKQFTFKGDSSLLLQLVFNQCSNIDSIVITSKEIVCSFNTVEQLEKLRAWYRKDK